MKSPYFVAVLAFVLCIQVCVVTGQDPYDEAHECQLYRQCKNCLEVEFCVSTQNSINRWWFPCPKWARYCNPYKQACEATPIDVCQKVIPKE